MDAVVVAPHPLVAPELPRVPVRPHHHRPRNVQDPEPPPALALRRPRPVELLHLYAPKLPLVALRGYPSGTVRPRPVAHPSVVPSPVLEMRRRERPQQRHQTRLAALAAADVVE